MQLEVVCKDFEVTEAIKSHAEKATAKLQKIKVETTYNFMRLKKDGSRFVAEYTVRTNYGEFFGHGEDVDCYKAINEVVSKVYEQIKKKLDKLQD